MPTQGDALGYERIGLSGRSLSERVNCDIIAKIIATMWPQTLIFEYQNVNPPNGGNILPIILLAGQQLCKSNKD